MPLLEQLDAELATEPAIREAWRDLVSTSEDENLHRKVEELNFRRDTLWAIARRRGLDLGTFGVFRDVTSVLTDNPDAVQRELDLSAGVEHQPVRLSEEPTGQAVWQRIAFEHDFDHVDYDVTEFDERAGTPGLHTVAGTVKAEPRATLLPPDLFNRFVNDAFWRDPQRIPEGLRVV